MQIRVDQPKKKKSTDTHQGLRWPSIKEAAPPQKKKMPAPTPPSDPSFYPSPHGTADLCFESKQLIPVIQYACSIFQTYQHIFTSPLSASDENKVSEPTARQRDVATMLRMDGHVTGQSIAYGATQVSQAQQIYLMSLANLFF